MTPLQTALQAERKALTDLEIKLSFQAGRLEGMEAALRLLKEPETMTGTFDPQAAPTEPFPRFTGPEVQTSAPAPEPQAKPVRNKGGRPTKEASTKLRHERRLAVAQKLSHGPLTQANICRSLSIPDNSIQSVLDHPWFIRDPSDLKWRITPQCRQEFFDSSDSNSTTNPNEEQP